MELADLLLSLWNTLSIFIEGRESINEKLEFQISHSSPPSFAVDPFTDDLLGRRWEFDSDVAKRFEHVDAGIIDLGFGRIGDTNLDLRFDVRHL